MGNRANFVIIRQGSATAYHDQWAALGCAYFLADGPGPAEAELADMERVDELLDWAFAEGGYLLDFDQKKLIAFGLPDFEFEDESGLAERGEGVEVDAVAKAEQAKEATFGAALLRGPQDFLQDLAPQWAGWLLAWDERGVDAFAAHLESREIKTIKVEAVSHPETVTRAELQA